MNRFLLFLFFPIFSSPVLAQGITELTNALNAGEAEIRSGVMPAVVGILTAVLLISVAVMIVWTITRNQ